MFVYGFSGLVIGFIIGVMVNVWLLRGVPHAERLSNRRMRRNYGLLNWAIALFGMIIGMALKSV